MHRRPSNYPVNVLLCFCLSSCFLFSAAADDGHHTPNDQSEEDQPGQYQNSEHDHEICKALHAVHQVFERMAEGDRWFPLGVNRLVELVGLQVDIDP